MSWLQDSILQASARESFDFTNFRVGQVELGDFGGTLFGSGR